MFQKLKKSGIKTVANVKPWLLTCHPDYEKVKKGKGFIWNNDSDCPSMTRLWSSGMIDCRLILIGAGQTASGSYIDFSSDFGRDFWKNGVKELLDVGVSGIWNDNNEFSISDDYHCCSLNGGTTVNTDFNLKVALSGRIRQTFLMASASYEAMLESDPQARPFLISRAGAPGSQK
jgi:alpha-glucosidase